MARPRIKPTGDIRRALTTASRAPRTAMYRRIEDLVFAVESGDVIEFKIVATGRGIDIFTTEREQYE